MKKILLRAIVFSTILILAIAVLTTIVFVKIKDKNSTDYLTSPPPGTQTIIADYSFTTNTHATVTANSWSSSQMANGPYSWDLYEFDGMKIIAADIVGTSANPLVGDGEEELLGANGGRFVMISQSNPSANVQIDDFGMKAFNRNSFIIVRVNNNPTQPNKYLLIKPECGSPCNFANAAKRIAVYALTPFDGYTKGQKIFSLPTDPANPSVGNIFTVTADEIVLDIGETIPIIGSTILFDHMSYYALTLSPTGQLSFTFVDEQGFQPGTNPQTGQPITVNEYALGNSYYQTRLCRQNAAGACTNVYDNWLFNNDFWLLDPTLGFVRKGGFYDVYGTPIAQIGGGTHNLNIFYSASTNHVDSVFVINAGTDANPDYRLIVMEDGSTGSIVSKIKVDTSANLLFPTSDMFFIPPEAAQAQSMSVGYVKGVSSSNPQIINGPKISDAVTGATLALATSGNPFGGSSIWYADPNANGGYAMGDFGYEVQAGSLQHVLPKVETGSSLEFYQIGLAAPPTCVGNIWCSVEHPCPTGEDLGCIQTSLINPSQGGQGGLGLVADYNIVPNTISIDLMYGRSTRETAILQSTVIADRGPYVTEVTQAHKDAIIDYILQPRIGGGKPSFDGWKLMHDLSTIPQPSCSPNGATQSCNTNLPGECAAGTQTCTAGFWSQCAGNTYSQLEICTDNLDNDCDGIVNNGCTPLSPSDLTAITS